MIKYHYSERVGDFAVCRATDDCPLGDTKHIEVSDDMTIGDFNKLKEEFYEEQYNVNISSGLKKTPKTIEDKHFNGEDYDPREYTMKIDRTTYISQLVEPGSTFAFKNKVYQVKDTDFDKFSGEITINTTNGEKIIFNEDRENSFRASAKEIIERQRNGEGANLDSPFKRANWSETTKEVPLSDLKAGMFYAPYRNADPKLVLEVDVDGDYGGDSYNLTLIDSDGEVTEEKVSDNYTQDATFYTVENERFDAEAVNDKYYSSEKFYEGAPTEDEVGDPNEYTKIVGMMNWKDNLKEGTIFRRDGESYKVKNAAPFTRKSEIYGDEEVLKIETTGGEEIYYGDSSWSYDDYDKIFVNPNNYDK